MVIYMSDNKNIEKMTLKQAVEEHEKKLQKMKQQQMKKRKAMAEKNMKAQPSELEKSSYTLQDEIAKQVQAVMTDGESMTDNQPTTAIPEINRQGAAYKNAARQNTGNQNADRQNITRRQAVSQSTSQSDKTKQPVSQNTRNMASDAKQIREQIAKKREVSRASNSSIQVRSEVDDWLERKQQMLKKRQGSEKSSSVVSEGMPEEIEDSKKLRFIWNFGEIGKWFQSLCWLHIPIFGMLYIIILAIRKKTPPQKRYFAIAWILYKVLVWILALTIIYILYKVGLDFVDGIMSYIK